MAEPFTLRVFVPSGDPEGSRIVEKMNWTGRGYLVPRADWPNLRGRAELQSGGVYILIGRELDELGVERPLAYIGQAEDIRKRIDQHDAGKDFWDQAMFFISPGHGLNRAHITWIEWSLMAQALKAKRCRLENGLTHSEPALSESEKADVRSFLNEMLRLMPAMGIHIFEVAKVTIVDQNTPTALTVPGIPDRDVVIVPAQPEGFQRAFIDSQAWWSIRIGAKQLGKLKWIAAYQVLPIAAVTHIAEIDQFEPFGDEGNYYKVIFKGPAQKLAVPIPFGKATSGAMQGPRYCTRATFDNAKTVADLMG